MSKPSLKQVEHAIKEFNSQEQQHLLKDLPALLNISFSELGLLKIAEPSFDFWNNPDDQCYDAL